MLVRKCPWRKLVANPHRDRQRAGQQPRARTIAELPWHHAVPEYDAVCLLQCLEDLVGVVNARKPDGRGEP